MGCHQIIPGCEPQRVFCGVPIEPLAVLSHALGNLRGDRSRTEIGIETNLDQAGKPAQDQSWNQALQRGTAAVPNGQPLARPCMRNFARHDAQKAPDRQKPGGKVHAAEHDVPGETKHDPDTLAVRPIGEKLSELGGEIDRQRDNQNPYGRHERLLHKRAQHVAGVPAERR